MFYNHFFLDDRRTRVSKLSEILNSPNNTIYYKDDGKIYTKFDNTLLRCGIWTPTNFICEGFIKGDSTEVGVHVGNNNQINFSSDGDAIYFNYTQTVLDNNIEKFYFCGGKGTQDLAEIRAGDIYTNEELVATEKYVSISKLPAACMQLWGSSTPPDGWLECNGQSFNDSTFTELALVYGNKLPDMRGYFVRGWDHGRGVDSGRGILTSQTDLFKSHGHQLWLRGNDNHNGTWTAGGSLQGGRISEDDALATGGVETRPKNVSFMYIVRKA